MTDKEKVVSVFDGLRQFADMDIHPIVSPDNWLVYSNLRDAIDVAEKDIIALLEAQKPELMAIKVAALTKAVETLSDLEPRVVQLEEIKEGEAYWFSTLENHKTISYYAICVHREEDAGWPYITFVWQHGTSSWPMDKYGYNWCCWTTRPTDK